MVETFFDGSISVSSDMELLSYMLQHNSQFYSLPTERALNDEPLQEWSAVSLNATQGLFDACAIGRFLFGIDPRNGGVCMRNGYLNDRRGYDLWKLRITLDIETATCTLNKRLDGEAEASLYNIHFHSKLSKTIADPRQLSRIIGRLNNGRTTLLSVRLSQLRPIRAVLSRMNWA